MFGKKNSLVKNLYRFSLSLFIITAQPVKADNQPPHPEALQSWEDQTSTLDTLVKDLQDKKIPFKCDQPYLYPTHPDQSMKH
jgi:hypothetical protein